MPLCFDTTGEIPAIPTADKKPALHINAFSLGDLQDVANAAQMIQQYPDGHGNGTVILEFVNGFLSVVKVQIAKYRERGKKKPKVN